MRDEGHARACHVRQAVALLRGVLGGAQHAGQLAQCVLLLLLVPLEQLLEHAAALLAAPARAPSTLQHSTEQAQQDRTRQDTTHDTRTANGRTLARPSPAEARSHRTAPDRTAPNRTEPDIQIQFRRRRRWSREGERESE